MKRKHADLCTLKNPYVGNLHNFKSSAFAAGLQKHMEGLTNDVERSNEMVFTHLYLYMLLLQPFKDFEHQASFVSFHRPQI